MDRFPATRYQGSKLKLLPWLWQGLEHLSIDSALDLFSGSASVSYLLKSKQVAVTANDYLRCNQVVARALVVNEQVTLPEASARALFERRTGREYGRFIEHTFEGIFFPTEENRWLDVVAQNIAADLAGPEQDIAWFCLFQSCLAKRPYNLFHRANLYMRTAEVERGFGNKATWDRHFEQHFLASLAGANGAVFASGRDHVARCGDFLGVEGGFDLVYVDPPYLNARGVGVDYLDFYHFLEGLTEYTEWPRRYTTRYKHRPYERRANPWARREQILGAFSAILDRHRESIVAISYRSNGIPTIEELGELLAHHGRKDARASSQDYRYVLSREQGKEVLLVSEPG